MTAKRINRGKEPRLNLSKPFIPIKPQILIVCEGENTEPSYFKKFKLLSATVKSVGVGYNTISLIERAEKISKEGKYDQVWCVFDKDDFQDEAFNQAIAMAKSKGFHVAYSNQAFEYWILLHFNDHQGGRMHRDDYNKKINSHLSAYNCSYDGKASKMITDDIFDLLEANDPAAQKKRRDLACKRARGVYDSHNSSNHAKKESSTTVFSLVEELSKYF